MLRDAHGLEVTAGSAAAVRAFDHALIGYLGYRADTPLRMAAVFEADPEFGLAHCLKGYFAMLGYRQSLVPMAEAAAGDAARLTEHATPRERAHVAALRRWIDGEPDRAAEVWEQILAEHPRDILAFRLATSSTSGSGGRMSCWHRSSASSVIGATTCLDITPSLAAAASRMRNAATTPKRKPPVVRRSIAIQATFGRRMAWRMCWKCRAGAAKASPGSTA